MFPGWQYWILRELPAAIQKSVGSMLSLRCLLADGHFIHNLLDPKQSDTEALTQTGLKSYVYLLVSRSDFC